MYRIRRPPAHLPTFELPEKKKLEALTKGDIVKVIFTNEYGMNVERMWCEITKIDEDGWIEAKLNNSAISLPLVFGEKVKFHVTDIINIYPKGEVK